MWTLLESRDLQLVQFVRMDFAELETLAEALSTGFEALLAEVRMQRQIEKALKDKIEFAAREVCNPLVFSLT